MDRKLFILNLPKHLRAHELSLMLSEYAEISNLSIDYNIDTGEQQSAVIVSVSSDEDAKNIIDSLDGVTIEGRRIKVAKSNPNY